jgi:16S rRNA (cytidine1402-2'-O)-methyltransferase
MGERNAVLAREMTKVHEEFIRGTLSQLLKEVRSRSTVKGECTLLVAGSDLSIEADLQSVKIMLEAELENQTGSLSEIARQISRQFGLPKKTVYDLALEIRGEKTEVRGQGSDSSELIADSS